MTDGYSNAWERLKAEHGLEGAQEIMRQRNAKIKTRPGGSFKDKNFAKAASLKGVAARKKKLIGGDASG